MTKRLLVCLLVVALLLGVTACARGPAESFNAETSQSESAVGPAESVENSGDEGSSDVTGNSTTNTGATGTTKDKNKTTTTTKKGTVGTVAPDANKDYVPKMNLSNKTVRLLTHNNTHDEYCAYAKEAYGIDLQVEVVAYSDVTLKFVSYQLSNNAPDLVINGFNPAANAHVR